MSQTGKPWVQEWKDISKSNICHQYGAKIPNLHGVSFLSPKIIQRIATHVNQLAFHQ